MIIPDDVTPSWTNADVVDSGVYSMHRQRLWLCNYAVSLWPQIFSWTVINVYPASTDTDYRFETKFADRAILVTVDWQANGNGCRNSSCYATYPERRKCTENDAPIMFPSGDRTTVTACQPACYAKRRVRQLLRSSPNDKSLTDQTDPSASCPDCSLLDERVAYGTRRWLYGPASKTDPKIETWDGRTKQIYSRRYLYTGLKEATRNENMAPDLDVDSMHLAWDQKYGKCVLVNDFVFRTVVEPPWRDTAKKCKLTNFELGDDVEWGLRFREKDPDYRHNYGFLVKHSTAYCRAFARYKDEESGNCFSYWWQQALSYTILGDGIFNTIHSWVHPEGNCEDTWKVDPTDREQVAIEYTPQTNYEVWRTNVNAKFVCPPPNVSLSDLGIDVRVTGNRLYWNNVEGIISHFAMFRLVDEETPSYRSYGVGNGLSHGSSLRNEVQRPEVQRPESFRSRRSVSTTMDEDRLRREFWDYGQRLRRELRTRSDDEESIKKHEFDDELKRRWNELKPHVPAFLDTVVRTGSGLKNEASAKDDSTTTTNDEDGFVNPGPKKGSIPYNLQTFEYAAQRYLVDRLPDDDRRGSVGGRRSKRATDSQTSQTNNESNSNAQQIDEMVAFIQDEQDRNHLKRILEDIGISLSWDLVVYPTLKRVLRAGYAKTFQLMARSTSGFVTMGASKLGVRLITSKFVGAMASRMTNRAMVMLGSAATGVGILLDVVGVVSMAFDLALLSSWDPGNFKNESDVAFYYDAAKFFADLLDRMNRGPLAALELMQIMYETKDTTDPEGLSSLTANELSLNLPADNAPTNEASASDRTLNVDERMSVPKWFNRRFEKCFDTKNNPSRLPLMNTSAAWNMLVGLEYIGSLDTNSFGQRVFPDQDRRLSLADKDIVDLLTKLQYQNLFTVASSASADSRAFNRRVTSSSNGTRLALTMTAIVGVIGAAFAVVPRIMAGNRDGVRPVNFSFVPFWLIALLVVASAFFSVIVASTSIVPLDARKKTNNDDDEGDNDDDGEKGVGEVGVSFDDERVDAWRVTRYVDKLREVTSGQTYDDSEES